VVVLLLLLLSAGAVPVPVGLEVRKDIATVRVHQLGPGLPQRVNDVVHETNLTQHRQPRTYAYTRDNVVRAISIKYATSQNFRLRDIVSYFPKFGAPVWGGHV